MCPCLNLGLEGGEEVAVEARRGLQERNHVLGTRGGVDAAE
jgi:hypothetical protein